MCAVENRSYDRRGGVRHSNVPDSPLGVARDGAEELATVVPLPHQPKIIARCAVDFISRMETSYLTDLELMYIHPGEESLDAREVVCQHELVITPADDRQSAERFVMVGRVPLT